MKKISFDFDSTLSHKHVQKFAQKLIDLGYEVHIVTSRWEDPKQYSGNRLNIHDDLFRVANRLKIPKEHIHFTNMEWKADFFEMHTEFVLHLDDYDVEVMEINNRTLTKGILYQYGFNTWRDIIIKTLEIEDDSGRNLQE